ncbi:glycosyltransferase family 2 protein [Terrabacter sp. 2RAF25]|uniref:glycosyltransferase family 2 protein n=1 Tax=Terrabacter sp. 2RAF25 TaxID=3232998 RepID=UPI003F994CF4
MTAGDVAVVTVVHGRHDHLTRLLWGLGSQTRRPELTVVVAIDDDRVERVVRHGVGTGQDCAAVVPTIGRVDGRLPLSSARNLGVAAAVRAGATRVVMLDVDCIPSPRLVERYCAVMATDDGARPRVWAGEVAYLPPAPEGRDYRELDLDALAAPHAARPVLAPGETRAADDLRLFWSLSFATTSRAWADIGGFDEAYVGYGAEDTDFGERLARHGGAMTWVGGARAYHQHHPTRVPPTQHLHDIVANANRFAERWGWWPMEGWLDAFERLGLARREPDGSWSVTRDAP